MIQQIGEANETPARAVTEERNGGSVDQPTNKQDTSYAKVTFTSPSHLFIYKAYECTKNQTQTGTTTYLKSNNPSSLTLPAWWVGRHVA